MLLALRLLKLSVPLTTLLLFLSLLLKLWLLSVLIGPCDISDCRELVGFLDVNFSVVNVVFVTVLVDLLVGGSDVFV